MTYIGSFGSSGGARLRCLAAVAAMALGALGACGDDAATGSDASPTFDAGPDAPPLGDWQTLVEASWTVPAGTEGYGCAIKTIERDTWVTAFEPLSPLGTHHTTLARVEGVPLPPDGLYLSRELGGTADWCTGFTVGTNLLFGSGVGTPRFELPAGIAVKLRAGDKLLLNLHLFNVSDGEIAGVSGTRIKAMAEADVVHEAELVLMGKTSGLSIPAGTLDHEQVGGCVIEDEAIHVFAVSPHMHQLGTHLKTEVDRDGVRTTIYDLPYSFDEQVPMTMPEVVVVQPGDKIVTTCTYDNPTEQDVGFGESTGDEMCFSSVFYWPARNAGPTCDDL